jgi:hypothetical protein
MKLGNSPMLKVLLLALASFTTSLEVGAQTPATVLLDKKVSGFELRNETFFDGLAKVNAQTDLSIAIEFAPRPFGTAISPSYNFYVRLSCTQTSSGYQLVNDVAGDNQIGPGTTKTSWNLQ